MKSVVVGSQGGLAALARGEGDVAGTHLLDPATGTYNLAFLPKGAVLVPGGKAPKVVTRKMVREMKTGAVIVDVAVDQGGCVETTQPTSHSHPTYVQHGVVHYCVPNIPAAVPRSSTYALTNATLPWALGPYV